MLIGDFNNTIDTWITELEKYDFTALPTKPDPESWSLGQVYMHLIDETSWYMKQMEPCLINNDNASEEMAENAKTMFLKNEFPDQRIKGDPFIAENVKQPDSKAQLQQEMLKLKSEMNRIWAKIIVTGYKGKTKHPGLAYFNAEEWFQFAGMHLRHHLKQKRRIEDSLKIAT